MLHVFAFQLLRNVVTILTKIRLLAILRVFTFLQFGCLIILEKGHFKKSRGHREQKRQEVLRDNKRVYCTFVSACFGVSVSASSQLLAFYWCDNRPLGRSASFGDNLPYGLLPSRRVHNLEGGNDVLPESRTITSHQESLAPLDARLFFYVKICP